jgi:hypothetical protein
MTSTQGGHFNTVRFWLARAGTSITHEVWTLLERHLQPKRPDLQKKLASLLKVIMLLDIAPPNFIAKLMPQHVDLAARGQQLCMRLPGYLEQQRTFLATHWPLPIVLHPLVAAYAQPTHDDMWTNGLPR